MSETKRILIGFVYVVVIVAIAFYTVYDPTTGLSRNFTRIDVGWMFAAMFLAMLGFILISGKGFSDKPRPSRYH